jgi:hypothetical protein
VSEFPPNRDISRATLSRRTCERLQPHSLQIRFSAARVTASMRTLRISFFFISPNPPYHGSTIQFSKTHCPAPDEASDVLHHPRNLYVYFVRLVIRFAQNLDRNRECGGSPLGGGPQGRYAQCEVARGELSSHDQPPALIGGEIVGFWERLFLRSPTFRSFHSKKSRSTRHSFEFGIQAVVCRHQSRRDRFGTGTRFLGRRGRSRDEGSTRVS